jgi:hypothetical protein
MLTLTEKGGGWWEGGWSGWGKGVGVGSGGGGKGAVKWVGEKGMTLTAHLWLGMVQQLLNKVTTVAGGRPPVSCWSATSPPGYMHTAYCTPASMLINIHRQPCMCSSSGHPVLSLSTVC